MNNTIIVYLELFNYLACFEDVYLMSLLLYLSETKRPDKDGWYSFYRNDMKEYLVSAGSKKGDGWDYKTFNSHFATLEDAGLIKKETDGRGFNQRWLILFNPSLGASLGVTVGASVGVTVGITPNKYIDNTTNRPIDNTVIGITSNTEKEEVDDGYINKQENQPIDIPSSKTDDISFLSKSIDRILGISGAYTNDEIYRYAFPLFERGVGVEDMILVFDWAYDVLGGKGYSVTPKSCFNEEKFTGKLTDAKIWKNNNPNKVTNVSDLYLEWDKQKNPDKYAKQQEEEEKAKIVAKHKQEIEKRRESAEYAFDRLCSLKGWAVSQSNKGYFVDLIINSPLYKDMQSIFDEVKNNQNIDMFEFEKILKNKERNNEN